MEYYIFIKRKGERIMLSGKFICATYDYSTYTKAVPSPYFRKTFIADFIPSKCTVTVGCAGFYELYINGQKITKGLLAPYISNPDDIVYYDEYDITGYIAEGRNAIGIQLGNGFQNNIGGQIWDLDDAEFRGAPRVAFALEVTRQDGKTAVIEADTSVKTAPSPVLFDDMRCGVVYDARREITGWSQADFIDDEWENALIAETPRGERRLCTADPILPIRHLSPISVKKCTLADFRPRGDVPKTPNPYASTEKVGYLYDFGINTAGVVRLKISGERGQHIDLQFGEYINEKGEADISNINFYPDGYSQRDVYILKGEGEEIFEPQFTYHGYRYCLVLGLTEAQATENLLTMIVCSSSIKERGGFRCSDPVTTKLQAMTKNSTLSNFYYFPTDCPHREKNGWTGDAAASCVQTMLNFSPERSYAEWLRNIRACQRADGAIPGIVPTAGWGFKWGNGPEWDTVLTKLPYYIYIMRGDKTVLEENADAIFRYVTYLANHRTARGTVELGLGDWLPVTVIKSPLEFTDSVISMNILDMASYIFGVLNMSHQKKFTDDLYSEIRAAVRKYLVDFNTMTAIGDCQTSQALAIYHNVFEPGEKPAAFKKLLEIIKRTDDHIDCGFIGIQVLFRVLADFGEYDLAYKMLARPDYPSYGNFVTRGLTALPEDFKRADEYPNSLNHHFLGDISAFFIEYIGGIKVNPYREDVHSVNIEPCFIAALDNAAAYHETVDGRVTVKWERTGKDYKLTVNAPATLNGQIKLPSGFMFKDEQCSFTELCSGEYEIVNLNAAAENIIEL